MARKQPEESGYQRLQRELEERTRWTGATPPQPPQDRYITATARFPADLKLEEIDVLIGEANRTTAANEARAARARERATAAESALNRQQRERREQARFLSLNRQALTALGQLLPNRLPGEPLLKWLPRCQAAAVDAALLLAAYNDPALDIVKTTEGWVVRHKNTGQQIAITTTQEVADGA